mmetsp:Transcript_76165/g.150617  ORF Transcript_76165/g.150617 Transcript_76165/m.150617 type:complete len:228 (+) Transcript_76165:132-815(+)
MLLRPNTVVAVGGAAPVAAMEPRLAMGRLESRGLTATAAGSIALVRVPNGADDILGVPAGVPTLVILPRATCMGPCATRCAGEAMEKRPRLKAVREDIVVTAIRREPPNGEASLISRGAATCVPLGAVAATKCTEEGRCRGGNDRALDGIRPVPAATSASVGPFDALRCKCLLSCDLMPSSSSAARATLQGSHRVAVGSAQSALAWPPSPTVTLAPLLLQRRISASS